MSESVAICVLAKAPEPGQVKTRLCPPLTEAQAAELAGAFLEDCWAVANSVGAERVLLGVDGDPRWLPEAIGTVERFEQCDGDLGARMEQGVMEGLRLASRVILIGSDLPGLSPTAFAEAKLALADHDAAIGPTSDGGYYLIAMRRCEPGLLGGLPWSAPETFRATGARLGERGYSLAKLSPFDDVDDPEDLDRLERALTAGTIVAPATERALRAIGGR